MLTHGQSREKALSTHADISGYRFDIRIEVKVQKTLASLSTSKLFLSSVGVTMRSRIVSAAKPFSLGLFAAAIAAAAGDPALATLAPVLTWIASYANSIAGNLQSSEIERQERIAAETATFLHNDEIAAHVGNAIAAVLERFATVAEPRVRAQFLGLAHHFPKFWLARYHDDDSRVDPLGAQDFIMRLAQTLAAEKPAAALSAEDWQQLLSKLVGTLPEKDRPADIFLPYAAAYLIDHIDEALASGLTSCGEATQRTFRTVLLRLLGTLLVEQRAYFVETRAEFARAEAERAEKRCFLLETRDAIAAWRTAAAPHLADGINVDLPRLTALDNALNRKLDTLAVDLAALHLKADEHQQSLTNLGAQSLRQHRELMDLVHEVCLRQNAGTASSPPRSSVTDIAAQVHVATQRGLTLEQLHTQLAAAEVSAAERVAFSESIENLANDAIHAARKARRTALRDLGAAASASVKYLDAIHHYREASALYIRDREPLPWAEVQGELASVLWRHGRYMESSAMWREVAKEYEKQLGPENPSTLSALNDLALALDSAGRFTEAEPIYRRVLEARSRILGQEHPQTLSSAGNFATLLEDCGRFAEAEPLYREVLDARVRVLGAEHPDTLISVNNLAGLLKDTGKFLEAEGLYLRALEVRERLLGAEDPATLTSVNNLGRLYNDRGDLVRAEPLYRRALEGNGRVLGTDHPTTLTCLDNLAGLLKELGKTETAETFFLRALEARERVLGPEHPDALVTINNLAHLLYVRGDFAGSEPLLRSASEANERLFGAEHPQTLSSLNNLGELLRSKGDLANAELLHSRVLDARRRLHGEHHPDTLLSVSNLGLVYYFKGDNEKAEPLLRRALDGRKLRFGKEHPDTCQSACNIAMFYQKAGRLSEAKSTAEQAYRGWLRAYGTEHEDTKFARALVERLDGQSAC